MGQTLTIPKNRITPANIIQPNENEIVAFGSNESGIHAAGAAKQACSWGAVMGIGFGIQGRTFAIPTKDYKLDFMTVAQIKPYVDMFIKMAEVCTKKDGYFPNQKKRFLVTQIGCGLGGHTPKDIAPLFEGAIGLTNVSLPQEFWDVLIK